MPKAIVSLTILILVSFPVSSLASSGQPYFIRPIATGCEPGLRQVEHRQMTPILDAAESLFKAMKARNYAAVWSSLSIQSRTAILSNILRRMQNNEKRECSAPIAKDLAEGGSIAHAYWNAFLDNFDPDTVLEQSKWTLGSVKKDRAEILILHRKSENPAVLKMQREDGEWKVRLSETFGR